MATRRPMSRARNAPVSSSTNSRGLPRPQSALAKLGTPQLPSTSEAPSLATSLASTHDGNTKRLNGQSQENMESNIQVVIRCRRRSEREIQESSPIIISTNGSRAQSVTIETAAPTSVLGVVTLPPTRTYPFDVVFGPEADQAMVYQDVVHPMLEEVTKGYNCTLFAYGQTGTGKTHTMQGDVSLTPLGNPSSQAGMIPRALFKLFHHLENSGSDYSVKISFVELYNEELRDLLAPDLSAPTGSTQPMGMGGQKENVGALKIFDDSNKKGVFIQGLEEIPVKDFRGALSLLAKGSQRRQIAATKFNDHSSRSHSVFSITVHSKEVSSLGDDLLKVGKLNLVDLAGSENIGRSGAENKRAREAGMINQSLLTLGRVINALVDKSSHVPYRESKLTRLLQDSLGGRTKTCIIATISPARSNMEETLSTLDYAMRAKSIRNKPEVNQRMTRNALLKEYVGEIERLKSEVLAAREKNGIWFSEEHVARMEAEQELRETEMEEAKKQVEVIESQMRSVREEFEQSMALLMKTDGELKETKEKLKVREDELEKQGEELKVTQFALEEETVVRKAHAATENALDNVAQDLKGVVKESTNDVAGLFDKIERKTQESGARSKAITGQSKLLDLESKSILSAINEFAKNSQSSIGKTRQLTEDFQKLESESLTEHNKTLVNEVTRIQTAFQTIQSKEDASEKNLTIITSTVKEVQKTIANKLSSWSEDMQNSIKSLCDGIDEANAQNIALAEEAMNSVGDVIDKLVNACHSQLHKEQEVMKRQNELVTHMASQEIARLRDQNIELSRLLDLERKNSQSARDGLVKQISSLLVGFTEERDKELRQIASGVRKDNEKVSASLSAFRSEHEAIIGDAFTLRRTWGESLENMGIHSSEARQSASNALHSAGSSMKDGLSGLRASTSSSIGRHSESILQISKSLDSCNSVFDRERKIKKARIDATSQLGFGALDGLSVTQQLLTATSESIQDFKSKVLQETGTLQKQMKSFIESTSSSTHNIQKCNEVILEETTYQSPPTGMTPRKRRWQYVEKWERTQNRSDLLREYRRQQGRPSYGGTQHAASVALPGSDDEVMDVNQEHMEEGTEQSGSMHIKMETEPDLQLNPQSSTSTIPDEIEQLSSSRESAPQSKLEVMRDTVKTKTTRALQERSTNIDVRSRTTRKRR